MTWLTAALVSTSLFAIVSVLDKRLVDHLFPSFSSFNVVFGLLQFPIALAFFIAVIPTVGFDGGSGISWAIASGLLWAIGLSLFFYGLKLEEVSRAVPIQAVAPVFAAIMAVTLLGEVLSPTQWVAIIVVVLGAGLVSTRPGEGVLRMAKGRGLLILVASSFFVALAFVVSKEATDRMNVWAIQGFRALFLGIGVLAITWRPSVNREIRMVVRNGRTMGIMLVTEGVLGPVAALAFVGALSLDGPVSLVSAVTSSRPLLVLGMSVLLSTRFWNVLNEPLDRDTLGVKIVSTVMIVGGVVALALL